ncbi:MAG: hypothetical protein NZ581_06125 [Candidatus Caldarchaeum sp.]|nr:hypothetical protein [Candidatus Caldarchaeum sp.]MDW8435758.1 hypothetical protein [Candidatus Caldarchaeum sp.]
MMRALAFALTLLVLSVALPFILVSFTAGSVDFRGFGLILIGPFPVILEFSDPRSAVFLLLPVLLFGLSVLYVYSKARKIPIETE